jgi:hypothetical protein
MTPIEYETTNDLEALMWRENVERHRACHIDMGHPTRDVLRSGRRIIAWAPKTAVAA